MRPFNLRNCYPSVAGQEEILSRNIRAVFASGKAKFAAAPPPQGWEEDVAALSAELVRADNGRLVLTCSGQSALMAAINVACGYGRNSVAVEEWTFPLALSGLRQAGVAIAAMPMDEQGLVPEALERAARSAVKVLYTMPTVHNPLGRTMRLERRQEIVSIARHYDITIIEDAAYAYLESDDLPSLRQLAPERTFQILSLSKITSLSLRTGAIVVPPRYLDAVAAHLKIAGSLANPIMASALANMARDGSMSDLIRQKRDEGSARQSIARQILGYEFCAHPSSWFLILGVPQAAGAHPLIAGLAESGILVSDGREFRLSAAGNDAIRVSLGGETSRERLAQGLEALRGHLSGN